uniref:Uncharacterized protein n=1 Tax=Arundo donax TaxID=35708 RepID=A0A0A9AE63_ARUDO
MHGMVSYWQGRSCVFHGSEAIATKALVKMNSEITKPVGLREWELWQP